MEVRKRNFHNIDVNIRTEDVVRDAVVPMYFDVYRDL